MVVMPYYEVIYYVYNGYNPNSLYTVSPYMSYATYDWSIDQNDNRYQIISINNNVLQVKFLMNAIFDVYCDVCNSSGNHVKTVMYETLY